MQRGFALAGSLVVLTLLVGCGSASDQTADTPSESSSGAKSAIQTSPTAQFSPALPDDIATLPLAPLPKVQPSAAIAPSGSPAKSKTAAPAALPTVAQPPRAFPPVSQALPPGQGDAIILTIETFEIGGIRLGAAEAAVQQRLGAPQRVEATYWACCGNIRQMYYPDTTIELIEGETPGQFTVFSLATKRPNWVTRDGVKVGDRPQKVTETYGNPSGTSEEAGITTLYYALDEYASSLWFKVRGNQVVELGFSSQLT